MKFTKENASKRKVSKELTIYDIITDPNANLDFVIAELNGDHPMIVNHVSDRVYFIINGTGDVFSDGKWENVSPNDCIYIKKNTEHSIRGNLTYAIITSPPFAPENESER